jgi:membrane-bound ClpP family serine protease
MKLTYILLAIGTLFVMFRLFVPGLVVIGFAVAANVAYRIWGQK